MDSIFQQINRSPNADHWHRFRCSVDRFNGIKTAARDSGCTVATRDAEGHICAFTILEYPNDLFCVAEPTAHSPSPFRVFPDSCSVAYTNSQDSISEFCTWTGYRRETQPSKSRHDSPPFSFLSLHDHEKFAWLELEGFVLRGIQSIHQFELEGEPLFLAVSRFIRDLLSPDLLDLDIAAPSEFWPGCDDHWMWQQADDAKYRVPVLITPRLQRLLLRRERVLFIEDLAAASDVQIASRPRETIFHSACILPLIAEGHLLGVLKLLYAPTLCPLPGEIEAIEVLRRDLSLYLERTRQRLRMQRMAMVDGLTNLFNHRFFREQLRTEFQRAIRYQKTMALIMIDIDDFKGYNDKYGHLAGDRVLEDTARTIRSAVRDIDFVSRYGGEEFALILPEVDAQSGLIVAEKIRRAVEAQRFISEDGEAIGAITVSCGVTDNTEAQTQDVLIERADRALYWVKRHGRNMVRLASEHEHE